MGFESIEPCKTAAGAVLLKPFAASCCNIAIAATCRKTERMENVGTIFYTAPVAPHVLINAFFLYSFWAG